MIMFTKNDEICFTVIHLHIYDDVWTFVWVVY